jgi:hypothetical protein
VTIAPETPSGSRLAKWKRQIERWLPGSEPAADRDSTPLDVTQLLAGTTAVIGILASLAVTGVLGQAQRNHPTRIYICLGCVLAAALLWSWAAILPGRRHPWLYLCGVILFFVGLGVGVNALVMTQHDSERPGVSTAFNDKSRQVTATITADGLSLDKAMVVKIEVLEATERRGRTRYMPQAPPLYFGVVGPDANGKIKHTAVAIVPPGVTFVGVRAWTAEQGEPSCVDRRTRVTHVPQSDEAGCFLLQLQSTAESMGPTGAAGTASSGDGR